MFNSLKSLKRIKFITFLVIIQLVIGLMIINSSSVIQEESRNKLATFDSLFNFDKTYWIRLITFDDCRTLQDWDFVDAHIKAQKEYSILENLKSQGIINEIFIYNTRGANPISPIKNYLPEEYHKLSEQEFIKKLIAICFNEAFKNSYPLKVKYGRSLTSEDFHLDYTKENIPIILGLDYYPKVKLGDVFPGKCYTGNNDEYVTINYGVVGFLDNNAIPIPGRRVEKMIENISYSNAMTLTVPIEGLIEFKPSTALCESGLFIELDNPQYMEYIQRKLKPLLDEHNFRLEVVSLKDSYNKVSEALIQKNTNSKVLGGTLIFLSVLSTTATMSGEINKRKREFGIRISQGATINKLSLEVFFEIFIMCATAMLLSLVINFLYGYISFSIPFVTNNIIILCSLTLIISILPIIKLKKYSIIDLVRGE